MTAQPNPTYDDVARIVAMLGGPSVFGTGPVDALALHRYVRTGLPVVALNHLVAHFTFTAISRNAIYQIVGNVRTLRNKTRIANARLSPSEADRVARIARISVRATHVLLSWATAGHWLVTPHPECDGYAPLMMLATDPGTMVVMAILNRGKMNRNMTTVALKRTTCFKAP